MVSSCACDTPAASVRIWGIVTHPMASVGRMCVVIDRTAHRRSGAGISDGRDVVQEVLVAGYLFAEGAGFVLLLY